MIKTILVAARDSERLAEVTSVVARYGLGAALHRLGLEGAPRDQGDEDPRPLVRRTRLALEELGPTYVKLGQILATRGDLLPPDWIEELERLHCEARLLPFDMLRPHVEEDLGGAPEDMFAAFDPTPLAAASMAQVHRATLQDGRRIVLKIQRPGIRKRIEADLRLLTHFAGLIEAGSAEARRFQPRAMLRQLAEAMLEELDFTNEGRNSDRLAADFAADPRVVIPEVHWQWSSPTLLAMDFVEGTAPRNGPALRAAGIDPQTIANLGADIIFDMVLINGRFHADPHPGNLLCLPGNRLALLDFGMIGHVSPRRREEFLTFIQSLVAQEPAALAETLTLWSAGSDAARESIDRAAERLVARHGGGTLILSRLVGDMFPIIREERLIMPPDLLLIFKALVTIDGVLTAIDPGFDLTGAMQRSGPRLLIDRLDPNRWARVAQAMLLELSRIGEDGPRLIRALSRRLEQQDDCASGPIMQSQAIRFAGLLIGSAIVLAGVLIAAAMNF